MPSTPFQAPAGHVVIRHADGSVTIRSDAGDVFHYKYTHTRNDGSAPDGIVGTMVDHDGRTASVVIQQTGSSITIDYDAGKRGGSAHVVVDDEGNYSGTITYPYGLPRPIPKGLARPVIPLRYMKPQDKVAEHFDRAATPPRRDPLAIDLDRDGLETAGFDTAAPLLFDHNADGVRTGTGWLKPDDAWLVLDRNGNGRVDSGRELFGNDTLIDAGGVTRSANSGFEALAALDTGSGAAGSAGYGDRLFDARDAAYASVRLWQDLNQDGISQPGELSTLAQKGIVSISLQATPANQALGTTGNRITGKSVVRFGSGAAGEADSVAVSSSSIAGDLVLASGAFYSSFTDHVPPTAAAQALPNVMGSGLVRDLSEALSLGNAASASLLSALAAYAAATTRDAQLALLDRLIHAWGATSTMPTSVQVDTTPASGSGGITAVAAWAAAHPQDYARITTLERFNGTPALARLVWPVDGGHAVVADSWRLAEMDAAWNSLRESVYAALLPQTRLLPYAESVQLVIGDGTLHTDSAPLLGRLAARWTADPRNALIDLVELNRYAFTFLDEVQVDGIALLRGWIAALPAASPLHATLADLKVGTTQAAASAASDILLGPQAAQTLFAGAGDDILDGGNAGDALSGEDGDDVLRGNGGADQLFGGAGRDLLYGGSGNDGLNGGEGADLLAGGAGDDSLTDGATDSNEVYVFHPGSGIDAVSDAGGDDLVILHTGITLAGVRSTGPDLVLDLGGGQSITLRDQFHADGSPDAAHLIEQVQLPDASFWDANRLRREALRATAGDDDILAFETDDQVDGGAGNDRLRGRSGADLLLGGAGQDRLDGDAGADRLYGNADADILRGGDGADLLDGGDGNDNLAGNAGGDYLAGGAGADVVEGGEGDDFLAGGTGNDHLTDQSAVSGDTYLRQAGDGDDTLFDSGGADSVLLQGAATLTQVRSLGANLLLRFSDGGSLTLYNQLRADGSLDTAYQIERLVQADGRAWTQAQLRAEALRPTAADDVIYALDGADAIDAGAGNDRVFGRGGHDSVRGGIGQDNLYGEAGNDILQGDAGHDQLLGGSGDDVLDGGEGNDGLQGEAGNDVLVGGAGEDNLLGGDGDDLLSGGAANDQLLGGRGNDRYLLDRGWGADTLSDADATAGNRDLLQFGAGIAAEQIWFGRSGNDLSVRALGGGDSLTISGWFAGSANHVESFRTADGRTLSDAGAEILVAAMSAMTPPPPSQASLPPAQQQILAPLFAAYWN